MKKKGKKEEQPETIDNKSQKERNRKTTREELKEKQKRESILFHEKVKN
ncbi:MAG: hypothetical protein ACTSYH_03355 [Candidatus Heimdallarchaeaceae archaeon]